MAESLDYILQIFELVSLFQGRQVELIKLFFPVVVLFLLLCPQHQVLISGISSLLPSHQVGVLVVSERPLFLGLVVHIQVILVVVPFLPQAAEPSNHFRNSIKHLSHKGFLADYLVIEDVRKSHNNSREFIVALEGICEGDDLMND